MCFVLVLFNKINRCRNLYSFVIGRFSSSPFVASLYVSSNVAVENVQVWLKSKVTPRSHNDIAHLQPRNIPAKYQLLYLTASEI